MKILELLYKYRYKIRLNQTNLFDFVNSGSKEIIEEGFSYKVKKPPSLPTITVILSPDSNLSKDCFKAICLPALDISS